MERDRRARASARGELRELRGRAEPRPGPRRAQRGEEGLDHGRIELRARAARSFRPRLLAPACRAGRGGRRSSPRWRPRPRGCAPRAGSRRRPAPPGSRRRRGARGGRAPRPRCRAGRRARGCARRSRGGGSSPSTRPRLSAPALCRIASAIPSLPRSCSTPAACRRGRRERAPSPRAHAAVSRAKAPTVRECSAVPASRSGASGGRPRRGQPQLRGLAARRAAAWESTCSSASAAWSATAISTRSSSSVGRRPVNGSSTDTMPSTSPSRRAGATALSSGSQPSGPSERPDSACRR